MAEVFRSMAEVFRSMAEVLRLMAEVLRLMAEVFRSVSGAIQFQLKLFDHQAWRCKPYSKLFGHCTQILFGVIQLSNLSLQILFGVIRHRA